MMEKWRSFSKSVKDKLLIAIMRQVKILYESINVVSLIILLLSLSEKSIFSFWKTRKSYFCGIGGLFLFEVGEDFSYILLILNSEFLVACLPTNSYMKGWKYF